MNNARTTIAIRASMVVILLFLFPTSIAESFQPLGYGAGRIAYIAPSIANSC